MYDMLQELVHKIIKLFLYFFKLEHLIHVNMTHHVLTNPHKAAWTASLQVVWLEEKRIYIHLLETFSV